MTPETADVELWCPSCQWTRPEQVVPGGPPVCPGCIREYPADAAERTRVVETEDEGR